jgi:hypothetical protein
MDGRLESRLAPHGSTVHHPAMRRPVMSVLLAFLLPLCAAAQHPDSTVRAAGEAGTERVSPRLTPAFGLHYGSPMRISVALGVIIDLNEDTLDGILLDVEPGRRGIEYSIGYLRMIGRFGSGVSLRASALHTFSDPWEANPQTTYLGGEIHWMVVLGVGGRAGLFRRATGTPGSHDTLGTLGFSIGI